MFNLKINTLMKRFLLFAALCTLIFSSCKKNGHEPDTLTAGSWKAVAYADSRQPDGWQPISTGGAFIFRANGTYDEVYGNNSGQMVTRTWKRASSKPADVPEGTVVLEVRGNSDTKNSLMLINFVNNDEMIVDYYLTPELRALANVMPPFKFKRH